MQILPLLNFNINKYKNNNKSKMSIPVSFSGDHQRVDKGMERFFEFNKNRMPLTLLKYLNQVEDKKQLTPLQAQRNAFEMLSIADSVEDIKEVFPEEFNSLKTVDETKSTNGILALIKKWNPIMKELDIAPLKSKEDITVYLVKKIYLETKTLKEINQDIDCDLDEMFKSEFRAKYPDSPYISNDTFKALGIKKPDPNYMNSLKFTREGYSDEIGEIISIANKIYWDSLTQEQRDALAKKSTEKLENWWSSLSQDKKLEMIAQDENTLKMLEEYNEYKHNNVQPVEKKPQTPKEFKESDTENSRKTPHTKVGSDVLDKDAFFKRWASNKLAIYEAGLSPEEKLHLENKRTRNASARWEEMSSAEKALYISKLKSGSEAMRYTMIDAWNNSFNLLIDLSDFLSEKMVEKPVETLYSKEAFGEYMSEIMTEFWSMHTEEAKQFGLEISKAWSRVDEAIQNGKMEQLKSEIMQKRKIRMFDLQKYKAQKTEPKIQEVFEPKAEPEKKQAIKVSTKKTNTPKNDSTQKTSSKIKKGEIGYSLLVEFVNQVATEGKKYTNLPETMTPPEMNQKDISIIDEIPEAHKQDYENIQTMRTMPLIYVMNQYFNKRVIGSINTNYAKSIMEILPQLQNDTKKITYHDGETEHVIRLKPNVGDGSKYVDLYKELTKPITQQDVNQIMKKYFPEKINGKPTGMTKEYREKLYNYMKDFGTKYLTRVFSETYIDKYELNNLYYQGFKSAVTGGNMDAIKGLLDTDEYKYVIKNKNHLIRQMQNRYKYLPVDFIETYLSVGLSSIAQGKDAFEMFKKCYIELQKNDKPLAYNVPKNFATLKEKVKILAMEKALADIFYKATDDETIFTENFEDLLMLTEKLKVSKEFPVKIPVSYNENRTEREIYVKRKPNLNEIQIKYNEYLVDCNDWLENIQTDKTLSIKEKTEDLVCILNPDENNSRLDEIIKKSIEKYEIEQDIL